MLDSVMMVMEDGYWCHLVLYDIFSAIPVTGQMDTLCWEISDYA